MTRTKQSDASHRYPTAIVPRIACWAVLVAGLLTLAACGPGGIQVRTDGYGEAYTQFGRD